MGSGHARTLFVSLLLLALALGGFGRTARADQFVDRVNAPLQAVPKNKRSDLIILPVLAKLEPPPAEVASVDKAVLIVPSSSGWEAVAAWATAQPQKDVLKALAEVTAEEDYHVAMVFAQPYGVDAVADTPELISAGMYTELGDPPTLATAKFGYLDKMREMEVLSNVEATRLSNEGKFVESIDTLFDLLYFARQMADRPMLPEKKLAMQAIRRTIERIRDVVYQDQRADTHHLDYKTLRSYVERLESEKGYLGIERIPLPTGTFAGAEQILSRVLVEREGVNNETFDVVLARIGSLNRPWRLFSESAYWESVRPQHEGWYACHDMLVGRDGNGGLVYDWTKRWHLDPHDPYVKLETDFQKYVAKGPKYAALRAVLDGVEDLYPIKTSLRTEVAGTRIALAVYGYYREHNQNFPIAITAIRPAYVPEIDRDPYSSAGKPLDFFVPIRDNIPKQDPRSDPIPLSVHCYPPEPYKSFVVPLRDNTFVLYSVGPDDSKGVCQDATQDDKDLEGDYILWPPMISLIRQNLLDTGGLK